MKKIAIITARGGSKRIPRKNIKEFCGKPIIAYSIEAAIESREFDTVMVSTDDKEIAEIAKKYGAEIPFYRSEKTSDDYATTNDVLLEVIDEYEKRGEKFDVGCCIYPTAPFVTADKLKKGIDMLVDSDADTLNPVVAFSYPPQRALREVDGKLEFIYPEYSSTRSQDLEKQYHDVGQFYIFKVKEFMDNRKLITDNVMAMPISEMEVQDIDTIVDWKLAELKYSMMKKGL